MIFSLLPLWACLVLMAGLSSADAAPQVLISPGFDSTTPKPVWRMVRGIADSCTIGGRSGKRNGTGALSIQAIDDQAQIRQTIQGGLEVKTPYHILVWVYLPANTKCVLGADNFQCPYASITSDGVGVAVTSLLTANPDAWNAISGTVVLNEETAKGKIEFVIGGLIPGETLCFDDATVTRTSLADFRPRSDARINALRKRNVVLRIGTGGSAAEPVRIVQNRLAFPIGTALSPANLVNKNYTDFFEEHFNFCTDEYGMSTAWNTNLTSAAEYPTEVLDYCDSLGLKTRGHAADGELANWYSSPYLLDVKKDGTAGSLQQIADDRLTTWLTAYGDRIVDIEAINEMLNGRFWPAALPCGATGACICDYAPACPDALFPEKNVTVRAWAHTRVKAERPELPIFVNEYCMLGACGPEQSNPSTVIKFVKGLNAATGGAVGGFAEQGHMNAGNSMSGPDIMLKFATLRRELGPNIKLWVSELDLDDPDEEARANGYEMLLRALFASRAIEGIIFWGFWQLAQWRTDSYLVNEDWSLNAAGERLFGTENGLLSQQWRTNLNTTVDTSAAGSGSVLFRAFHGDYTVYYGEGERCSATFSVPVGAPRVEVVAGNWTCASGTPPTATSIVV